jgi:hypothetical protein
VNRNHEAELRDVLEKIGTEGELGIVDASDATSDHTETVAKEEEKPEVEASSPRPFSSKNMFVHHDTHPLVLDIKLMDQYGADWFEWEPETLWREIMDDFRAPSISDHVKSKIQAVKTIHISDWCFTKWEIFCPITQALNNNMPDFEILRRPTISQLFAGVDMMTFIRNDVEFSQEVQQFCGASMLDAGVDFAPQPLAFCQDEIEDIQKERNIPIDLGPVREKYKHLMSIPAEEVELRENPVDVRVAKLIIARDYLALRRSQMKQQLRVLR